MKQLLWKEWRKTRAIFFLFCALNLLAIVISDARLHLVATLVYGLTSIFLSLLLPAVVFSGDDEQNSGKFSTALPISRRFVWFSNLFYIALLSIIFHGVFYAYAFKPVVYILYFVLTTVAILSSHIFQNSLVIVFSSVVVFCVGAIALSLVLYALYFLPILTIIICVTAIIIGLLLLSKKEIPIVKVLIGLLLTVEIFCIYYSFQIGKVYRPYEKEIFEVIRKSGIVIFVGVGISAILMSYQRFIYYKSIRRISSLFLSIGTILICIFLQLNNVQYKLDYWHINKNTFGAQKTSHFQEMILYSQSIKTFDYESKKMQETNVYCDDFFSWGNELIYLLAYNIEHSWGIPSLKKYYVYNCINKKKYDIPFDPSVHRTFYCKRNYLLFLGSKQLDIVQVKDRLDNHVAYQIDRSLNFIGIFDNYAYFLNQKNLHLVKFGLNSKSMQIDQSTKQIFGAENDPLLFNLNVEILENRFLVLEKSYYTGDSIEFWIQDLRSNQLKKIYEAKRSDRSVYVLKIHTATNQCIISNYEQMIFVDLENGKTKELTGRFVDIGNQYFLLNTENVVQKREFTTNKIVYEKSLDVMRMINWKRKGYIILGYTQGNKKLYYYDTKKQTLLDKKLPAHSWVDYIDENQGVFYVGEDKKLYYSDRNDNSIVVH
ncbi:hypothetical protein [Candidatus Uabimicrobium sp. HlEnr_7]|uniref:hypothetical protein n=1 Tax=Candidatus Uabimicrobium helgolandensis TaxID=3095367 RepID=UPI003557F55F